MIEWYVIDPPEGGSDFHPLDGGFSFADLDDLKEDYGDLSEDLDEDGDNGDSEVSEDQNSGSDELPDLVDMDVD